MKTQQIARLKQIATELDELYLFDCPKAEHEIDEAVTRIREAVAAMEVASV